MKMEDRADHLDLNLRGIAGLKGIQEEKKHLTKVIHQTKTEEQYSFFFSFSGLDLDFQ